MFLGAINHYNSRVFKLGILMKSIIFPISKQIIRYSWILLDILF